MTATVPRGPQDLTAGWLDSALDGRLGGPVGAVTTQRIGEGFGLAGETYRLDVEVDGGPPVSLVAKLCDGAGARHEGRVYAEILPPIAVAVPRFLASVHDGDSGAVVLEFVPGTRQGDCLAGCSLDEARDLARALAALHAPWWATTEAQCPPWLLVESEESAASPRLPAEQVARCVARLADDLDADGRKLISSLPGRMEAVRDELATHPAAVTHRDFHLDNVLFDPAGRPVILDWALAGWGAVAADVGRVLVECLGTRDLPGGYDAAHEAVLDAYRGEIRRLGAGPCPRPELARGVWLALHVTLAGAVGWAGAAKRPAPGSREVALARNLALNCVAALLA